VIAKGAIDSALLATGAVVWFLLACYVLAAFWHVGECFVMAASYCRWLIATCKANDVAPRWVGLPQTYMRVAFSFWRHGSSEWTAKGSYWRGIGDWKAAKEEPESEEDYRMWQPEGKK
jgi:hypothetical protein